MKTKTIIFYILGIAIIGAIIFFLLKWRKKLETEKQELETGSKPLIAKDFELNLEAKPAIQIDRSQIESLKEY